MDSEQVELFCVDHLLMVEINCSEESLVIDFVFPTTNVGNVGFGENLELGITGTEAVMQIVREIIVGFHWEEDALGRSKQSYRSSHESLQKNLEGKSTESIMEAMCKTTKDSFQLMWTPSMLLPWMTPGMQSCHSFFPKTLKFLQLETLMYKRYLI